MSALVSIDPGQHGCWGRWVGKQLDTCGLWPCFDIEPTDLAVIETQVIVPKFTKRPKDIITLAHHAGAAAAAFGWPEDDTRVTWVPPRTWKGNTRKPKAAASWASYGVHRLVVRALTKHELAVYTVGLERFPPSGRYDLIDAVGIGLGALGRLK